MLQKVKEEGDDISSPSERANIAPCSTVFASVAAQAAAQEAWAGAKSGLDPP